MGLRKVFMTSNFQTVIRNTIMVPHNLHELVRGQEQNFVRDIEPVVRSQSVTLDMTQVERIDAAGIAALITLYGTACASGHDFMLVNTSQRVEEILALVGLDRILLAQDAIPCRQGEACFETTAA
jgi:anti-anti-sigma factor